MAVTTLEPGKQVSVAVEITNTGKTLGNMATMPALTLRDTNIIKGVIVTNDQNVLPIKLTNSVR